MVRLYKTANVTNVRNVLIQIPGAIIAQWGLQNNDTLEVSFDEETNAIIVKPGTRRGGNTIKPCNRLVNDSI